MTDKRRPSRRFCPFVLWLRMMTPPRVGALPFRSRLGLLLLVVNIPFGYLMLLAGTFVASFAKQPRWLVLGTIGYALSWLMLGLGVILAGPELCRRMKKNAKNKKLAWKRLRRLSANSPRT